MSRRKRPNPTEAAPAFAAMGVEDLRSAAQTEVPWLWQGYLAPGNVTLLTSQWKAGKTTLVSVLLGRMGRGGSLAGRRVRRGRAVVVSEEGPQHWHARAERLGIGKHVAWYCRPFRRKPRPHEWEALLEHLAGRGRRGRPDLVVIDTLASFLPARSENDAGGVLEALLGLQQLTAEGAAVLVLHHPRKGAAADGQAARGSGALPAFVDVLVEMTWYRSAAEDDRRRRLLAWSRHEETPRSLVIELNAAGTDYLAHGDVPTEEYISRWPELRRVLAGAKQKLTRAAILAEWPEGEKPPNVVTVWRWLERAVAERAVERDGEGTKELPYRYWLAGQVEKWRQDPLGSADGVPDVADIERMMEEDHAEALRHLYAMSVEAEKRAAAACEEEAEPAPPRESKKKRRTRRS